MISARINSKAARRSLGSLPRLKSGMINSSMPRSANCPTISTNSLTVPATARPAGAAARAFSVASLESVINISVWAEVHMVSGSRATVSQACMNSLNRSATVAGLPQVFHSSAWRAVKRIMREPPVPTRIGMDPPTGLGSQGASVIR